MGGGWREHDDGKLFNSFNRVKSSTPDKYICIHTNLATPKS
jgi:hypothetical protein